MVDEKGTPIILFWYKPYVFNTEGLRMLDADWYCPVEMKNGKIKNTDDSKEAIGMDAAMIDGEQKSVYLTKVKDVITGDDAKKIFMTKPEWKIKIRRTIMRLSRLKGVVSLDDFQKATKKDMKFYMHPWGAQSFWIPKGLFDKFCIEGEGFVPTRIMCEIQKEDMEDTAPNKPGYVYFMKEFEKDCVKIGYSINPNRRWCQLNTSQSDDLEILALVYYDKAPKLEAFLHGAYKERHKRREFYNLTRDEVIDITNHMNGVDSVVQN